MTDIADKIPTFNVNTAVRNFMRYAGCTIKGFNAEQACLYTGLQLEELAEKLAAIAGGCVSAGQRDSLIALVSHMTQHANSFKQGMHVGDIMRGDREGMLDADIDLAWVALGGAYSVAEDVSGACQEIARANLDKFPGGVATLDENGKVKKPVGWRGPDISQFIAKPVA